MNAQSTTPAARTVQWYFVGGARTHESESQLRTVLPIASRADHILIGRGSDNDITVADRTISRVHAHLRVRTFYIEITDNFSRNGTHVNGQALKPGMPHRLYGGEHVRFGSVDLHIVDAETFRSTKA